MIEETEETSQQMFERVKIQIESTKQESEEILKYQTKEAKQDPKQKEQEIKDLKSDASIFPLIERDLQEFNRDFSEDPALENFKLKYETLYHSLTKFMELESNIANKCIDTNTKIKILRVKIESTLTQIKDFQARSYRKMDDIESTWKSKENYQLMEKKLQQELEAAQMDIVQLDQTIEQAKLNFENDNRMKENRLREEEKNKIKERTELMMRLTHLREINAQVEDDINQLDKEKLETLQRISKLKKDRLEHEKLKEEHEIEKRKTKEKINFTQELIEEREHEKNEVDKAIANLETEIDQIKVKMEKQKKDKKKFKNSLAKITNSNNATQKKIENKELTVRNLERDLQDQDKEINSNKQRYTTEDKEFRKRNREFNAMTNLKNDLELEMEDIKRKKELYSSQLEIEQKALEDMQKLMDTSKQEFERDVKQRGEMEVLIKGMKNKIFEMDEEFIMLESKGKKLENKVKGYQIESIKLNKQIQILQKQQEKYGIEASTAHARYYQTVEQLKIKNNIIAELQKKNLELESKLKHQMNLYEAVRADRNLYSKNLLEAQNEISNLTKKYTRMARQINQLREEINTKNAQILKENKNFGIKNSENDEAKSKKDIINEKIRSTEEFIKHHENQIAKLKFIIGEAMTEKQKQTKDYEMVLNERDILGAQLIKRNQELKVLYEKIKIAQSNLSKGEISFKQKKEEFEELKEKLMKLRREKLCAVKFLTNKLPSADKDEDEDREERGRNKRTTDIEGMDDLKKEVHRLEKQLLKQRTKVRALTDELKYPMNVHRWNKMEATDPDNYARIMKIQTLQRRLITKTEEVEEKEKLIKQKEKLFKELNNILARQPGPEVHEQIQIYRSSLKDKTSQLKKMLAELKDAQEKVNANKWEINRITSEINKYKQEYFKKRDMEEREKLRLVQQMHMQNQAQNGGVYNFGNAAPPSLL